MFRVAMIASFATALWMVPSVGTHGQGTIGDRFVHADRSFVADTPSGHALLLRADHEIAAAVSGH